MTLAIRIKALRSVDRARPVGDTGVNGASSGAGFSVTKNVTIVYRDCWDYMDSLYKKTSFNILSPESEQN